MYQFFGYWLYSSIFQLQILHNIRLNWRLWRLRAHRYSECLINPILLGATPRNNPSLNSIHEPDPATTQHYFGSPYMFPVGQRVFLWIRWLRVPWPTRRRGADLELSRPVPINLDESCHCWGRWDPGGLDSNLNLCFLEGRPWVCSGYRSPLVVKSSFC